MAAAAYARAALVEQGVTEVRLRLRNLTASNVAGVRLELTVPAPAVVYDKAPWGEVSMPIRPRRWGPVNRLANPVIPSSQLVSSAFAIHVPDPFKPDLVAQPVGSTRIVFAPEHVRPESHADLPAVSVFVRAEALDPGRSIRATWRLTATSHDSVATGHLDLRFAEPVRLGAAIRSFKKRRDTSEPE